MDATKNSVKENKKALTGITLDGQEKYLWLFYFRFPHLYCKLLHFYHFYVKNFDYPEKPLKYKHIRRISD